MAELSAEDRAELSDVGFYWSGAYRAWFEDGRYRARRKGDARPEDDLLAETPAGLREMIRGDYFRWLLSIRPDDGSMSL